MVTINEAGARTNCFSLLVVCLLFHAGNQIQSMSKAVAAAVAVEGLLADGNSLT
jgi:hypothetical protein